jgi:hypothetical protein
MTILETIKRIVFNHELKFAMYDLVDGTKVEVEGELGPGAAAYVVDPESGERSAAPAGSHELAEPAGTSIVVNEQGLIDDVKVADSPTAETEEDMSEEAAEEVAEIREEVVEEAKEEVAEEAGVSEGEAEAILEQVISIVEDKVTEVTGPMMEELKKRMDEYNNILLQMAKDQHAFSQDMDVLKNSPSGTPISKTAFSGEEVSTSVNEKRMQFLRNLKNK